MSFPNIFIGNPSKITLWIPSGAYPRESEGRDDGKRYYIIPPPSFQGVYQGKYVFCSSQQHFGEFPLDGTIGGLV